MSKFSFWIGAFIHLFILWPKLNVGGWVFRESLGGVDSGEEQKSWLSRDKAGWITVDKRPYGFKELQEASYGWIISWGEV